MPEAFVMEIGFKIGIAVSSETALYSVAVFLVEKAAAVSAAAVLLAGRQMPSIV